MGTYQKMKQAEAEIERLEKFVQHTNVDEIEVIDEPHYFAEYTRRKEQLESARHKYRTLKYEYNAQRTLLVFAILGLAGILYVAITRGVI